MRVYQAKGVSPAEITILAIFRKDPNLCKDEVRIDVGSDRVYIPNHKHYWQDFLEACKTCDTEEPIDRKYGDEKIRIEFTEDSKVKIEVGSSEIVLDTRDFIDLLESVDVTR